jgi:hypothetical protein
MSACVDCSATGAGIRGGVHEAIGMDEERYLLSPIPVGWDSPSRKRLARGALRGG